MKKTMKRLSLWMVLCLFTTTGIYAQNFNNRYDFPSSAVDYTGTFRDLVHFGNDIVVVAGTVESSANPPDLAISIQFIDPGGNVIWSNVIGEPGVNYSAVDMVLAPNGNDLMLVGNAGDDIVVVRVDPSNNILCSNKFGLANSTETAGAIYLTDASSDHYMVAANTSAYSGNTRRDLYLIGLDGGCGVLYEKIHYVNIGTWNFLPQDIEHVSGTTHIVAGQIFNGATPNGIFHARIDASTGSKLPGNLWGQGNISGNADFAVRKLWHTGSNYYIAYDYQSGSAKSGIMKLSAVFGNVWTRDYLVTGANSMQISGIQPSGTVIDVCYDTDISGTILPGFMKVNNGALNGNYIAGSGNVYVIDAYEISHGMVRTNTGYAIRGQAEDVFAPIPQSLVLTHVDNNGIASDACPTPVSVTQQTVTPMFVGYSHDEDDVSYEYNGNPYMAPIHGNIYDCNGFMIGSFKKVNGAEGQFETTAEAYPNPAGNYVNVKLNEIIDPNNIEVYAVDAIGRRTPLGQTILEEQTFSIDISALKTGIYQLVITDGDRVYNLGISKE